MSDARARPAADENYRARPASFTSDSMCSQQLTTSLTTRDGWTFPISQIFTLGLGAMLLLTILVAAAAAAQNRGYVQCAALKPNPFHDTLWARHTSCRTARQVVRAYMVKAQVNGPNVHAYGFWCVSGVKPGQEPAIRCRRGDEGIVYRGEQS